MINQSKLFQMSIKQPDVIVKFGKTTYMNVEYRFSNHTLLQEYDLEVTFSQKMSPEEADRTESEYLQKYPKQLYEFETNYEDLVDGEDEMRFMDKGVINKVIQELYDKRKNDWSKRFKHLNDEDNTSPKMKFYFVTFFRKGSKSHSQWQKRVEKRAMEKEQKRKDELNLQQSLF